MPRIMIHHLWAQPYDVEDPAGYDVYEEQSEGLATLIQSAAASFQGVPI